MWEFSLHMKVQSGKKRKRISLSRSCIRIRRPERCSSVSIGHIKVVYTNVLHKVHFFECQESDENVVPRNVLECSVQQLNDFIEWNLSLSLSKSKFTLIIWTESNVHKCPEQSSLCQNPKKKIEAGNWRTTTKSSQWRTVQNPTILLNETCAPQHGTQSSLCEILIHFNKSAWMALKRCGNTPSGSPAPWDNKKKLNRRRDTKCVDLWGFRTKVLEKKHNKSASFFLLLLLRINGVIKHDKVIELDGTSSRGMLKSWWRTGCSSSPIHQHVVQSAIILTESSHMLLPPPVPQKKLFISIRKCFSLDSSPMTGSLMKSFTAIYKSLHI